MQHKQLLDFSDARQENIKDEIKAKQATLEALEAQKKAGYQSYLYEQGIADVNEELAALENELIANQYAQYNYARSQGASTDATGDFTEETEEATDKVERNTIQLDKNTQSKLNNISIQNESIAAMLNLVNAIQKLQRYKVEKQ